MVKKPVSNTRKNVTSGGSYSIMQTNANKGHKTSYTFGDLSTISTMISKTFQNNYKPEKSGPMSSRKAKMFAKPVDKIVSIYSPYI